MTALILDTESTGFNEGRIIEVAWIQVTESLHPMAEFHQRYNPGKPIEMGALATHHIMDEDLADCAPHTDFRLPDGVQYLIGYNVDYDWKLIGSPDVKRICVLAMCRHLWPEVDSHSQGAMLYYLHRAKARELLKEAHSAKADAMNCMRILWRVLQAIYGSGKPYTWEELWQYSENARIPTVISFGKHKGMAIKELPADYKQWLLRQPDVDPYLEKALRGGLV